MHDKDWPLSGMLSKNIRQSTVCNTAELCFLITMHYSEGNLFKTISVTFANDQSVPCSKIYVILSLSVDQLHLKPYSPALGLISHIKTPILPTVIHEAIDVNTY